jgi:hypothetical protein
MAVNLNYNAALLKAQMDQLTATVGPAGKLWLYDGTQPANCATTATPGTLIAGPWTLGTPFAAGATSAVPSVLTMTLPATATVNATKTGQPTWFRITTSAGAENAAGVIDGSAGTSNADMIVGNCTIGLGVTIVAPNTFTSGT